MTEKTPTELWSEFLAAWPLERVREMTIEEYTNPNRDDAFIYWLESRLQTLGSIWGGSAFKFGVYCRENTDVKEARGWSCVGRQIRLGDEVRCYGRGGVRRRQERANRGGGRRCSW